MWLVSISWNDDFCNRMAHTIAYQDGRKGKEKLAN